MRLSVKIIDTVKRVFIVRSIAFLDLIHFDHLICFYVLYSFSHPATVCQ